MTAEISQLKRIERRLDDLADNQFTHYRGEQAADFTTTTLPHKGDYGYQTTDDEVQMNCNGTVRAIPTNAL